jgi:hypothetical protein
MLHRGVRSIVGKALDYRVARAAVGAIYIGAASTYLASGGHLSVSVGANVT